MKNFSKNNIVAWIPIVIMLTGGLFATNRISMIQCEITAAIEKKLDKEIYDRECKLRDERYERILQHLKQIEAKLDYLSRPNPQSAANAGDQDPKI